ncbi:MAG: hypothetical protein V4594_13695 [Bacteroidota bacterium]
MKKLINVSPFLLLLVPIFVVMLLSFTSNEAVSAKNEEVALKSNSKANLVKVNSPFTK